MNSPADEFETLTSFIKSFGNLGVESCEFKISVPDVENVETIFLEGFKDRGGNDE